MQARGPRRPSLWVLGDVPPHVRQFPLRPDHAVVIPRLPREIAVPCPTNSFGTDRFKLPDDGPQTPGSPTRRDALAERLYTDGFPRPIGFPRSFDDSNDAVKMIRHHHPRVQPHALSNQRRPRPLLRHDLPRLGQPHRPVAEDLAEKRSLCADRDEVPARCPIVPRRPARRLDPVSASIQAHAPHQPRSSERYCTASARCSLATASAPARSAMVRATLRMRS